MIAMTFDDGPSLWTERILNMLKRHDARATFFVCGHNVREHEWLLLRMREEGHEIGNHGWSHFPLDQLSDDAVRGELATTSETIERITGEAPRWWRAPHLRRTEAIEAMGASLGMEHIGFTLDSLDWRTTGSQVVRLAIDRLRDGDILDLHDGYPPHEIADRSHVAPAVDQILAHFAGVHDFVTIGALRAVAA